MTVINRVDRLKSSVDKAALGRTLFALAGIERIHIIGCGRSGTTMLHLAMMCFKNVILSPAESNIQHPYFRERLRLALRLTGVGGRKHYVTKRGSGWIKPERVDELIKWTRLENIGIIHIVRDPRDVMLSKHAGSTKPSMAYVSQERWHDSILAADRIFRDLADHSRKLTLRYEDVILQPMDSQRRISTVLGLCLNPNALSIDRVKDNFERLGVHYDERELPALNGLRNMDAETVWHWRKSEQMPAFETMPREIRARLEIFCEEHGYEAA